MFYPPNELVEKMKKKIFLLLCFPFFLAELAQAQIYQKPKVYDSDYPFKSVYLELGGSAVLASVNYDVIYSNNIALRFGISPFFLLFSEDDDGYSGNRQSTYISEDERQKMELVGIFSASKLFGNESNKLETGIGFVFGQSKRDEDTFYPRANGLTPVLGYRFIPNTNSERKAMFRATFTPIINSQGFHPWFGLSFGYLFPN